MKRRSDVGGLVDWAVADWLRGEDGGQSVLIKAPIGASGADHCGRWSYKVVS